MRQVAGGPFAVAQSGKGGAHVVLGGGCHQSGLADLGHIGDHESRLDTLDEDTMLSVFGLQIHTELIHEGLHKSSLDLE